VESRNSASTPGLRPPPRTKSEKDKARVSAELENAKAELQRLKAEAAATAERAAEQLRATVKKSRDAKVRLRVIAVVMLTAALVKITWQFAAAPVVPVTRLAPLPGVSTTDSPGMREFTRSLNRLRDAFHSLPEEDQVDVVREINEKHPGAAMACPLVWNAQGVPTLFLGDKKGDVPPSMIAALEQCASEIEKLRAEKSQPK
jgi:hypothetical protein